MSMLLRLAWRNILRNPRRSLLTASAMGIAVAFLMAGIAFTEGMYGQMRDALVTRNLGHVQIHHPAFPGRRQLYHGLEAFDPVLAALDADPSVELVAARVYGQALVGGADRTEGAQLLGVDPDREQQLRQVGDRITAGTWLDGTPNAAVLGDELADRLEVGVGDEVVAVTQAADGSVGNDLYTVTGLVHTGSPSVDRATMFLSRADLSRLLALPPDTVHEVVVVGHDDDADTVAALAETVRRHVGDREALVRTWEEVDPTTAQLFGMQSLSTAILISLFYGVSAVGVVNTLLMGVFERTREFGVLRAIGMRARQLVALVVLESFALAVLAVALGVALGGVLDLMLVQWGVDLSVGGEGYVIGDMTFDPVVHGRVTAASVWQPVVGVLAFTLLAAIWPAVRAARLEPVDAIREAA